MTRCEPFLLRLFPPKPSETRNLCGKSRGYGFRVGNRFRSQGETRWDRHDEFRVRDETEPQKETSNQLKTKVGFGFRMVSPKIASEGKTS